MVYASGISRCLKVEAWSLRAEGNQAKWVFPQFGGTFLGVP